MKLPLLGAALCISGCMYAQSITSEDRDVTLDSLTASLSRNYVYPEMAEKMISAIRDHQKAGDYDGLNQGPDFASALTDDLIEISHDLHIRVRFDPARIAEYNNSQLSSEEEEAFMARELARAKSTNFGFEELKILEGNVGYFKFNGFSGWDEARQKAMAAMQWLSDADALIFDLRDNGGGDPQMVQVISTYLFDQVEHLNTFYWRPSDSYRYFYTLPAVPGDRMPEVPVYVLVSGRTFSAAEEFTYNLKNMERATIVGQTTGGGAHPGGTVSLTDKFLMFMPQGRAINPITETNWEGTGIVPDIETPVSEAIEVAHLDALTTLRNRQMAAGEENPMLDWAIAEMQARQNPVVVSRSLLGKYAGNYGPRQLVLQDDGLYYRRGDSAPRKMIPITEDTFFVDGVNGFRIKMIREGNKAVALEGQYLAGHTDRNERDQ